MKGKHGPGDYHQKENLLELKPAQLKPLRNKMPVRESPDD